MARKSRQDAVKEKEAKQKKIAIGGSVLLVALLAFQVPRTMKMLHHPAAAASSAPSATSITTPGTTPVTVTPADPNSLAAPSLSGAGEVTTTTSSSSGLVSAVPMTANPGQLDTFERFASKDPFAAQASSSPSAQTPKPKPSGSKPAGGSTPSSPSAPSTKPPATPSQQQPQAPAPTSAAISLNGDVQDIQVNGVFPTSGSIFNRLGSIFRLVSLTATSAKVAIVGGSYANGAAAIPLQVGVPLTLQNTADGAKYTLILEPQSRSAQVDPGSATTPASTTPINVVPSTGTQ